MLHYDSRTFTMNRIRVYYKPAISQNPYDLTVNNVYKNMPKKRITQLFIVTHLCGQTFFYSDVTRAPIRFDIFYDRI